MKHHPTTAPVLTPSQARARITKGGTTISEWAMKHQVPPHLVYAVLGGNPKCKCKRGMSYRIAVLLGIKNGELA